MEYFLIQFAQKISAGDIDGLPTLTGDQILQNGLNIVYALVAITAVVVIIIGGITFSTSGGDSAAVTRAKNMILYSIVGIVVVLSAFAVTNFVIGRF